MTDQTTPREVIGRQLDEDIYELNGRRGVAFPEWFGERAVVAIQDAGYVIVPKPSGNQVEAAVRAYADVNTQSHRVAMACALAAADAVDDDEATMTDHDPAVEAAARAIRQFRFRFGSLHTRCAGPGDTHDAAELDAARAFVDAVRPVIAEEIAQALRNLNDSYFDIDPDDAVTIALQVGGVE